MALWGDFCLVFPMIEDVPLLFPVLKYIYLQGKELSENLSTQSQPLAPTNFLHDLDRVTQVKIQIIFLSKLLFWNLYFQDVVSTISEAQRSAVVGQNIVIPQAEAGSNEVIFQILKRTKVGRRFIHPFYRMF